MSTAKPRSLLRIEYENAAEAYLRSLPPEHFMEATSQAKQREITVESLALVHAARPEIQYFNELLVQYPLPDRNRPGQVVPDNMVVVCHEPIRAEGSYDIPLQPVRPFWMMEYVSKASQRKDYEDSFHKYEVELRVPYYLLFYPQIQELTLYRHDGVKYVTVTPNEPGRYALPELDMEVGLRDGWVRYWHRSELVPLPAELERAAAEANRRREEAERQALQAQRGRDEAERRAEELARGRQEAEQRAAESQRGRQEAEQRAAESQRGRQEAEQRTAEERQARLALEQRLAQLQAQLEQRGSQPNPNP
jgi:Uma2 family endonuclease